MRQRIAATAAAFFFIAAAPVYAASLPPNLGVVQDRASFFDEQEKAELRQEATDGALHFYILTIAGLNGAAPDEYATDVYRSWGLSDNDVLIVIADDERRVEINFHNPSLQHEIGISADMKSRVIAAFLRIEISRQDEKMTGSFKKQNRSFQAALA